MKGVIMAGGKGTRLRPLTCNRPKPMVPLLEKPVMQYSIEWLKRYGITEIAVTIQYLPDEIKDYFGDGSDFGVKLTYFEETTPLGTAGSVKQAESFLNERFVVVSGDALTDFSLSDSLQFHHQKNSLVTILMKQVEDPTEFGVIMTNKEHEIIRFLEKPNWSEVFSDTVNTGIYIMEPEVFHYIKGNQMVDFSKDVFPEILKSNKRFMGYHAKGYWSDIGNIEQYRQAQFDMLNGKVKVELEGKLKGASTWVDRESIIEDGVELIEPVYIGKKVKIKKGAKIGPFAVIGSHTIVDHLSSIKHSIVWDHTYIGKQNEIRGVTICEQTQTHANAQMYEGAIIGSHVHIDERVTIRPDVKLWPYKKILAGLTVSQSLVWNERKVVNSLFKGHRLEGTANVEMTPDFVSKVGLAFGGLVKKDKNIYLAADGHAFSNLLKLSISQSIQATGKDIRDIGKTALPIFRAVVEHERGAGGLFIKVDEENPRNITLEFYGEKGLPLHSKEIREMEKAIASDSYHLASYEDVGGYAREIAAEQQYINRLTSAIEVSPIRNRSWKIAIIEKGNVEAIQLLFHTLKAHIVTAPSTFSEEEFSQFVVSHHADIGFIFDQNLEFVKLFTHDGSKVKEEEQIALFVYLELLKGERDTVAIPIYQGETLEKFAASFEKQVVRTKLTRRLIMEAEGTVQVCSFDAIYAVSQLLNTLTIHSRSLTDVVIALPIETIYREEVTCHIEKKGMVMRKLMELFKGKQLEMSEGLKVSHQEGGWTFIVPSQDEPIFTIYSKAPELIMAKRFTQKYVEEIKQIK
ncbi:mannose-1-phosphate guanylyltransferase [Bacillus sp. TS-2]|nr:mannose-1-phosphate guanylyltransferase [Bacillus sp. TS-2]